MATACAGTRYNDDRNTSANVKRVGQADFNGGVALRYAKNWYAKNSKRTKTQKRLAPPKKQIQTDDRRIGPNYFPGPRPLACAACMRENARGPGG